MYLSTKQGSDQNYYIKSYITKYICYKNNMKIHNDIMHKLSNKCCYELFSEENLSIVTTFFGDTVLQFLVFLTIYDEFELINYIRYVLLNIMKYDSLPQTVNISKELLTNINKMPNINIWNVIIKCIKDIHTSFKQYSTALLMYYF